MKKPVNSIKMKPRTVRGRTAKTAATTVRGINRTAKSAADKAQYAKRRTEVKPDAAKPEDDATNTVQETAEQWIEETPRTAYRLTRVQIKLIRRSVARRKEAARSAAENASPPTNPGTQTEQPSASQGSASSADHSESPAPHSRASPVDPPETPSTASAEYSDPRNRPLSARELEKARANKRGKRAVSDPTPVQKSGTIPAGRGNADAPGITVTGKAPSGKTTLDNAFRNVSSGNTAKAAGPQTDKAGIMPDSPIAPRSRRPQRSLLHEKPAPSLPARREILRQPVKSAHIIESAPKQTVKTADAAARTAARQALASERITTKASQKIGDLAAKNASKAARHMANLSRQAAQRTATSLRRAARAAMRVTVAAAKALIDAIISGGWAVVVVILVLLMCASILASPFGIFTHTDTTVFPNSITLSKAITTINDEYVDEIKRLRGNADNVSVLIEGNLEGGMEPINWVDVLGVFAVHVTMREDGATDVVLLDEIKMNELRKVFWDMNKLTVSTETRNGETTTNIEGRGLSYQDMYEPYAFTDQQKQLIKELMSDEYYAFWSNFVNVSTGYDPDDWSGVVDEDYEPGMSGNVMKIPKIYQFDYKKTVCKVDGENKSASTSGCGATSMCMVIHYLTGNKSPTPYTLFKWAYEHGHYSGDGLGHGAVDAMGKLYGVTGTWVGKDGEKIVKALTSGHPVIAHMGKGIFTKQGHYIVLRGVTKDGKILVNDPNSKSRSGKAYPLSTILKQGKTSTPFMICSKKSD